MGLLSGLGADSGMFGLLPMLMQQKQGEKPTGFQAGMQNLGNDPMFANNVSMATTGQPQLAPPSAPMGGGLAGAFSGNPQFQQQLQAIQNGQGPGHQAPQFTPPPMQMNGAAATGGQGGVLGMRGNPLNNYGMSMGDPMQSLIGRMGRSSY